VVLGIPLAESVLRLFQSPRIGEIYSSQWDRMLQEENPLSMRMLRNLESVATDSSLETSAEVFADLSFDQLVPRGSTIALTVENLPEYIQKKKQAELVTPVLIPVTKIVEGISDVIGRASLDMFTFEELREMIRGPMNISAELVVAGLSFRNPPQVGGDEIVQWLIQIISELTEEERKQFLYFISASYMPPFNRDEAWIRVFFDSGAAPDRLPRSQTCFNEITFPIYPSFELMKEKLLTAISSTGTIENN